MHLDTKIKILLFLSLAFACNKNVQRNQNETIKVMDSISMLLKSAKVPKKINPNKDNLQTAYALSSTLNDSARIRALSRIAYKYFVFNNSQKFLKTNTENIKLAEKTNDSAGIAQAHWNFGDYYDRFEELDSAFYHFSNASKIFADIGNSLNSGRILYEIARIQKNLRDYTGAEITTFQSISKLGKEKDHSYLYLCYNLLGVIYHNLKEFDKSIEFHNKALDFLEDVENKGTLGEGNLNNIGLVYQKKGDSEEARTYFEKALATDSLEIKNRALYARLTDNLTYSKFLLNKNENLEVEFQKALNIRDSMNNISGIALSKLHLSEYYAYKQDTTKAVAFAQDAHDLAESVDNHTDQLNSLLLLSKIDYNKSDDYLSKYITLSDSLQTEDRAIRNKFTRISYETDEYIEQTEKLSRENLFITIIGIGTLLLVGSIFVIRLQRARNKRLLLEQEQQNDREQIYKLMIDQQSKLEEGRVSERTRISEELHDGILGSMYGTRMGLGFLEIEGNKETKIKLDEYLNELLQIEKEVRDISHALQSEILKSKSDFVNTIETYLEKVNQNNNLVILLNSDDTILWDHVSSDIKINLFRIIQETYYNTLKYAKANNFILSFSLNNEFINLVIEDDGVGFNIKKTKKGIGIKNIQNRIEHLQGNIKILSSHNKGTKISVSIKS